MTAQEMEAASVKIGAASFLPIGAVLSFWPLVPVLLKLGSMGDFRGNKLWDYRRHETNRMAFATAEGRQQDDIKRRALTVLRSYTEGGALGRTEIEGPLWALVDVSYASEAVKGACLWFQAAADFTGEEETRLMLCREAYGKIERALRCYL